MSGPTYQLTDRVTQLLGEPVTLAMRVTHGPSVTRPLLGGARTAWEGLRMHPIFRPLGSLLSPLAQAVRDWQTGTKTFNGILAVTDDGGRVLLGRRRFLSTHPTDAVRRLRHDAPLLVDKRFYDEYFIADLVVDNEHFVVHPVDFRVLLKEIDAGRVEAPEVKFDLGEFYQRQKRLASNDPDFVREKTERRFFFKSPSDKKV